jgi:hypothetical protein
MFFRIERTGPPDGGPARSLLSVRCPLPGPTLRARLDPRWASRVHRPGFFKTSRGKNSAAFARLPGSSFDPRDIPARAGRRRAAGRLPARHAHTCHAPTGSGFAAGAVRPSLGPTDIPVSRSVLPFSQLLTLAGPGWSVECIAASAARRHGDPVTDPHSGTRDSPPSLWPLSRLKRLRRERLRRERLCRVSVPPDLSGPLPGECTFPSPGPPLRFCSFCSARCLTAKSTS